MRRFRACLPSELNPSIDRLELYPHLAENSLTTAIPGSSAAGEQPKFLAKRPGDSRDVMVKFSPAMQIDREFVPPLPSIEDAALWPSAWQAAQKFWQKAAAHRRISADFRKIAAANVTKVASMAKVAALLPRR